MRILYFGLFLMIFNILLGIAHGNFTLLEEKVDQLQKLVGSYQQVDDNSNDSSFLSLLIQQAHNLLGAISTLAGFIISFQFLKAIIDVLLGATTVDILTPYFPAEIQSGVRLISLLFYFLIYTLSIYELLTGKSVI